MRRETKNCNEFEMCRQKSWLAKQLPSFIAKFDERWLPKLIYTETDDVMQFTLGKFRTNAKNDS